jgi:small conductance mechanosensitive channel
MIPTKETINIHSLGQLIEKLIFEFGPKLVVALALLFLGLWLIKKVVSTLQTRLSKRSFDISLQKFLLSLLSWTLKIMLFISVLGQLGIQSTSFVAVLGAAGLAVGLALQGSLANLAGGVLIMIFRPFKVGDLIETQAITGHVKLIDIFTTKILTNDHKLVIIPNGALSNGNITNLSAEGTLKLNLFITVPHDTDLKFLRQKTMEILESQEKVLKNPQPHIDIKALGEKGIDIIVRPTVNTEDYDEVYQHTFSKILDILPKRSFQ